MDQKWPYYDFFILWLNFKLHSIKNLSKAFSTNLIHVLSMKTSLYLFSMQSLCTCHCHKRYSLKRGKMLYFTPFQNHLFCEVKFFTEESFSSILALLRQVTNYVKLHEAWNGSVAAGLTPDCSKCAKWRNRHAIPKMRSLSTDKDAAIYVVEGIDNRCALLALKKWAQPVLRNMKTGSTQPSKRWKSADIYVVKQKKKSEITINFKCWHCSRLCGLQEKLSGLAEFVQITLKTGLLLLTSWVRPKQNDPRSRWQAELVWNT